jgi:tetratricopeptide (TPR) repeat protein
MDYTPTYISEPLAFKRRREGSLTADPEMMYQNEFQEIDDLVNRYEELESYESERKRWAKYRYGRNLLARGRKQDAKGVFRELLKEDPFNARVLGMAFSAYMPNNKKIVNILENIAYHYRRFRY